MMQMRQIGHLKYTVPALSTEAPLTSGWAFFFQSQEGLLKKGSEKRDTSSFPTMDELRSCTKVQYMINRNYSELSNHKATLVT